MRLQKEYISMCYQREKKVTQITLDEDVIVPDSQPDLDGIVLDCGDVELDEVRPGGGRVMLKGRLTFSVLYGAADGSAQTLAGALPFEEVVNVMETVERDQWKVNWDLEDLSIGVINSRKLSVRAVVTFVLVAEQLQDAEVAVAVEGEEVFDVMTMTREVAQMAAQTRDAFRFREEIDLENNRPNLHRLLWKRLELRGFEVRPLDGSLSIRGEFALFVVYAGEEEHIPLQYLEKTLPFSGTLELPDCTEEMIPDVTVRVGKQMVEPKPDYDGEMRMLGVETLLELDIRLYEERQVAVLADVYCPTMEIVPEKQRLQTESLLIKNVSRAKVTEHLSVGEARRMLQICHCAGIANLDRAESAMDCLVLEGALLLQLLYLETDDVAPMKAWKGAVPFRITVEAKGMTPETQCRVTCRVEQLGAVMLGGGEVEVKAVVEVELLALHPQTFDVIGSLTVQPLDPEQLEALPGMCGYIVQPGDTLWKIAKECRTTVDLIREMNGLAGREIAPGDRLLVIKQTANTIG